MVLPKGIVVNSADIYAEVASYPTVPPEKIWEYWHVYTTTFRKLIDPTAHRLENFWWHVWGSDRRFLSGAILARLFEEISTGPSIVDARSLDGFANVLEALQQDSLGRSNVSAAITDDPPLKPLSSSSSKPPPPHPILKKSRGPSSSGPRPTARFVSPQESADEKGEFEPNLNSLDRVSGESSCHSPTSPLPKEKSESLKTPEKRKETLFGNNRYAASSSISKRRHYNTRRSGSQSSGGSAEVPSMILKSPNGLQVSKRHVKMTNLETSMKSKANDAVKPGEKAIGKRGIENTTTTSSFMYPSKAEYQKEISIKASQNLGGFPVPRDKYRTRPDLFEFNRSYFPGLDQMLSHSQPVRDINLNDSRLPSTCAMSMERSISDREAQRISHGKGHAPLRGLSSSTTTTTFSSVAAQGTFQFDQASIPVVPKACEEEENEAGMDGSLRVTAILGSRFTPTAPNPTPDVEMGRTKSQLNFLLEEGKSRLPGND